MPYNKYYKKSGSASYYGKRSKPSYVYSLNLSNGKKYVGRTQNIKKD